MHGKESSKAMAFVAKLSQLRYNSVNKEGGGPHTLVCAGTCKKPFNEGDLINGPSRNRSGVSVWRHPNDPAHYHKLVYWHDDCAYPQGRYTNSAPIPSIKLGAANGWQRSDSDSASSTAVAVYEPPDTDNADTDGDDSGLDIAALTSAIIAAVNGKVSPMLQAFGENIESKLAEHIRNEVNAHGLHMLTDRVRVTETVTKTLETSAMDFLKRLEKLEKQQPTELHIHGQHATHVINVGTHHPELPKVVRLFKTLHPERRNVWLAGPAGSGKTTAMRQIASCLIRTTPPTKPNAHTAEQHPTAYTVGQPLPFYFNGAIDTEYKLSGFVDANGNVINTAFREAWTNGGVYLFDEVDASMSGALTAFNGALANGHAPFPGELLPIARHPDCYIGAAGNTMGYGGDANYVGRAKIDGAFLSRFIRRYWGYDDNLEKLIAGDNEWTDIVKQCRDIAAREGANFLITPRDSLNGADLRRADYTRREVADEIFGYIKRQDATTYARICRPLEDWVNRNPNGTLTGAVAVAVATPVASTNASASGLITLSYGSTSVTLEQPEWEAIKAAYRNDGSQFTNKIEAIKLLREETGIGLLEAKNIIEQAEREGKLIE